MEVFFRGRDYSKSVLDEHTMNPDPVIQFAAWYHNAIDQKVADCDAMFLATAGKQAIPSGRMVLLKSYSSEGFLFFTNYESRKAKEIEENPVGSLTFYWKELEQQIRINGTIKRVPAEISDAYFHSRSRESQISAFISPQSYPIENRKQLEERWMEQENKSKDQQLIRPQHWGGYRLIPEYYEFFQGRSFRLHDRIAYERKGEGWSRYRLAP